MNVSLSDDLKQYVEAKVSSGAFASETSVFEAALRPMRRREEETLEGKDVPGEVLDGRQEVERQAISPTNDKPIWEVMDELRASVPPEEFLKLPKDGAEQLDHYLYGSPKRPTG